MSTDVSSCGAGDGSRPSARRRSSAITGPRNGTSTRPRANSSATMATSTPDAPSERSVRKPVPSTAFSSRAIRASSSRSATEPGPQIVGQLRCGLPQLLLFTCQTDVHSRSFSTRRNTFPDGRRGISATNSTRLGRLYDARESATNAISSWASTGAARLDGGDYGLAVCRHRGHRTRRSPRPRDVRAGRLRSRRARPENHAP